MAYLPVRSGRFNHQGQNIGSYGKKSPKDHKKSESFNFKKNNRTIEKQEREVHIISITFCSWQKRQQKIKR